MGDHHPMDIAVTGASGLIGTALVAELESQGHRVRRLVRDRKVASSNAIFWDPDRGQIDLPSLEGVHAAIHLAGENIGDSRWTEARKLRILRSRVEGTHLLASSLAKLKVEPLVMLSASGIGAYGNRHDEWLDEGSSLGDNFLAMVVKEWEGAAEPARIHGIRVAHMRTGVVLSETGGALPKMITPIRMGVGGRLGSGRQYMSWVMLEDAVRAYIFAMKTDTLSGPINVVTESPVTNAEFTETLARLLNRPSLFRAPAFALKLALGEMAQELLLEGQRVAPKKLLAERFDWRYPDLESALRTVLER